MLELNKDLFIYILFVWIFIASVTQIISGIYNNGETKKISYWDSLNGIVLVILLAICISI